jgi:hypothetical protein
LPFPPQYGHPDSTTGGLVQKIAADGFGSVSGQKPSKAWAIRWTTGRSFQKWEAWAGRYEAKPKLEVYKKFRARINRKAVEENTGLFMDAGNGTKQDLYRSMKKDTATGEWVQYFHFGK